MKPWGDVASRWGFTMWNITTLPYQTWRGFPQQLSSFFCHFTLSLFRSFADLSAAPPFCYGFLPHLSGRRQKPTFFFSTVYSKDKVLFHWNFITKITQSSILKKYKPPKQWSRFSLVFACILRSALSNPKVEKHYVTGYHLLFKTATSCIPPSVSWEMQLIWLDWLTLTK